MPYYTCTIKLLELATTSNICFYTQHWQPVRAAATSAATAVAAAAAATTTIATTIEKLPQYYAIL